ncbi:hypothetical protein Tco_0891395 [Tanacetum coccineum]|uniref:Integrase, catalytic region, zinc finger, CCHC-type, peptidase aspartic, catalytic n=1 Tax=Tanacetum coccineum TaxID=301880 RepID=A0ABQ5C4C9_9ASTR
MIIAGADKRPPMLEKSLYDSCKSRMEHYTENRENGRMILSSVQNGLLIWPTVIEANGLPPDVYAIVNHHKVAKEIWDRVKLLMQGTKLSLQEKECKLYDEFDKFTFVKGETLYQYYCLAILVFHQGDDLIAYLNKAMAFLTAIASSRVIVQQVQGRQGQSYAGKGLMDRQCTQPNRRRNAAWFKEKEMLAEAQEAGQILDEEQLAFLADLGIPNGQAVQTTIPNNAAFQTKDLDAYDSDCDDVLNTKAVLMANLSSYGSGILSDVPHSETSHNDMDNQKQMISHVNNREEGNQEKNNESVTAELERYKERVKTFEQRLNVDLSTHVMIRVMNSTAIFDDVNVEMQSSESCVKCVDLEAELLNKQSAYNDLSKSYSQLEKHCISLELTMQLNQEMFQKDSLSNNQNALEILDYFENNDLKA